MTMTDVYVVLETTPGWEPATFCRRVFESEVDALVYIAKQRYPSHFNAVQVQFWPAAEQEED